MSGDRKASSKPGPTGSFRLTYPPHATEGGREAFREHFRVEHRDLVEELERAAEDPWPSGSRTPEHNARSVTDAVATIRARVAGRRRSPAATGPSVSTSSAILVTISSVSTPSITPYLHSPWQWGVFGLSVVLGAVGLAGQWLGRYVRRRP